jgi:hypothetical protein
MVQLLRAAGWLNGVRAGGAFTTWDIQKKLGIKQARLKEWLKFLPPSFKASGPGTKNLFSRSDLYALWVFRELIDRGITREKAGELVTRMKLEGIAYSGGGWMEGFLLKSSFDVGESRGGVSFTLTVNFEEVKKLVDQLLDE